MLTQERARELLASVGAVLEGHFVGTNGPHLSVYIAKDRGTRLTSVVSELCAGIAGLYAEADIEVVVAPAKGAIALSQWTAYHLTRLRPDRPEVVSVYSEPLEKTIFISSKDGFVYVFPEGTYDRENEPDSVTLNSGDKIIVRRIAFVLERGFQTDVNGRNTLVVEDVLTTGGSARRTVDAIVQAGGNLIGVGVLANGGKNVTAETVGAPRLEALLTVNRRVLTEEECATHGMCAEGVPINTEFGHGRAFLTRKGIRP